jgi:cytochrome oxidase assembly protein ShyY1
MAMNLSNTCLAAGARVLAERGWVPPDRRATGRRTSGTAGCSRVALSAVAPTDAVEHLQQQGAQQRLRGDRGPTFVRVEVGEAAAQIF